MNNDPPPVRWVPDGEHAGIYTYEPELQLWAWTRPGSGICPLVKLPPGTEPLVTLHDVELAIDQYRDERDTIWENARASSELDDLSPGDLHTQARTAALSELRAADDYPIMIAEQKHERSTTDT